jgi:molybdenum cofactor cytidylyltransferase
VLPGVHGRRGHPVLFSREVLDEILGLPHSLGVNTVVRRDPHRIREVGVEDSGVTIDIDTPDDFERWRDQPTGSPRG